MEMIITRTMTYCLRCFPLYWTYLIIVDRDKKENVSFAIELKRHEKRWIKDQFRIKKKRSFDIQHNEDDDHHYVWTGKLFKIPIFNQEKVIPSDARKRDRKGSIFVVYPVREGQQLWKYSIFREKKLPFAFVLLKIIIMIIIIGELKFTIEQFLLFYGRLREAVVINYTVFEGFEEKCQHNLHVNIPKWKPSFEPNTSAKRSGKQLRSRRISAIFTLMM